MSSIIEIADLTKRYNDFVAVDHVSYQVLEGEILGLLGHNGAGKTTTILMLVGLIAPSEGTALVAGHDIVKQPLEARRSIGLVPEQADYYDNLTAVQNLRYYGELANLSRSVIEQRINELLEMVGLDKWKNMQLAKYSRGMRQRFGIAQSLIRDPKILIYDEPTLGLDPEGSRMIRQLIKDLSKKQGKTIMLCTHLLNEVKDVCDRVAFMRQGKLIAHDTIPNLAAKLNASKDASLEDIFMQFYEVA